MDFLHPWLLLCALPFVLLFFFLKKIERKRYLDIPTKMIVRKIGPLKSFFKKSGKALWILAALLLVIALAGPQSVSETEKIELEGRMMVLSIDLSTSMTSNYYSKTGRPAIEVTKELSLEFVKKRAATDLVGITVYGGRSRGRHQGEAAVIVFPNTEYAQLEASVKMLRPGMLGMYTSIGEGIFLSVISLLDQETLQRLDVSALYESLKSEDRGYALDFVKKTGRFNNRIIVLFTDGKNNAGIEPIHPLWLAKMLGIKVYFAELESTGATGLSPEEEEEQQKLLRNGVLETGGKHFEMSVVEQVKEFYEEIDRLETARLKMKEFEKKTKLYFLPVVGALILIFAAALLENIFPRIQ